MTRSDRPAPPVSPRLLAFALLGALLLVVGGVGLTRSRRADAARVAWGQALQRADRLEAELDARTFERDALWGVTSDEPAAPHYEEALTLLPARDADDYVAARRGADAHGLRLRAELLEAANPALAALHRGAHARDAARLVDWSSGFEGVAPGRLSEARHLVQLADLRAQALLSEGRELDAVGLLLDALQFAGDLAGGPLLIEELIGVALLTPDLLLEGVADGRLSRLSPAARARLLEGLQALDARLGWTPTSYEGELLLLVRAVEAARRPEDESAADLRGLAEAARHVERWLELVDGLDTAAAVGPDAVAAELERCAEVDSEEAGPTRSLLPRAASAARGRLYSVARFRLAVHALGVQRDSDPWVEDLVRSEPDPDGGGQRLILAHELFDDVAVTVAR